LDANSIAPEGYFAGLATGFYASLDDLRSHWAVSRTWQPEMMGDRREELFRTWKKAVARSFDWVD